MARTKAADTDSAQAQVLLGERHIGVLHYQRGNCWFDYQDLEPEHPVLGQRFEDDPSYGRKRVPDLPVWFANLLPERRSGLRRLVNSQLGVAESHDFQLALHLGEDLPGAVVIRPMGELPVGLRPVVERADDEADLGFSLSGMQLKFSVVRSSETFRLARPGEFGDWIVKLPSQVHPELPANEHAVMSWAGLAGIEVPEHLLARSTDLHGLPQGVALPGERAFAVRRFDRVSGTRVHQEDFAQVLGVRPVDKGRIGVELELLAQVVVQVCPPEDLDELVRRMVFCIGSGNTDEHLKNWSLRYPDGRRARLSPAYDLVCSTAYPAFRNSRLTLSISGQRDIRYLTADHFRRMADASGADPEQVARTVDETVRAMRDTWSTVAAREETPVFLREHIDERLAAVPLFR
ncbi:type II toxin-antitoxin system HipA family toxin [Kitasatospora phosalacinea]|uniref:Type II toxin-antitoxin system HipA family toxin n=1 Tax=Kitasatospora phosalacinea TaxID=2065 RepID=A0ABW6GQW4_9ACTN